jgi:hypothetical protein
MMDIARLEFSEDQQDELELKKLLVGRKIVNASRLHMMDDCTNGRYSVRKINSFDEVIEDIKVSLESMPDEYGVKNVFKIFCVGSRGSKEVLRVGGYNLSRRGSTNDFEKGFREGCG